MDIYDALLQSRPDKDKDREGWNKSWELQLKIQYASIEKIIASESEQHHTRTMAIITSILETCTNSQFALYRGRVKRDKCLLEEGLVTIALDRMYSDNFEAKWRALTQERREELVLEGLYRTCSDNPLTEQYRGLCPDMTVAHLAGQGGKGYIDMLKIPLANNVGVEVQEQTLYPHETVDKYILKILGSATPPDIQMERANFVTSTLFNILRAFYGETPRRILYKPVTDLRTREERRAQRAEIKKILGTVEDEWRGAIKEMKRQLMQDKAAKSEGVNICWNCNKDASRLDPDRQLKVCARCQAIGRRLFYCSRDCQKFDWTNGNPPHRTICGRTGISEPLKDDLQSTKGIDVIPSPDPGFALTTDLLYQISLLRQNPGIDYFIISILPSGNLEIGITAETNALRQLFLVMRHRALKNGDKKAIRFVYQMLEMAATSPDGTHQYSVSNLRAQFVREYGNGDLDHRGDDLGNPTEEEMKMAEEIMSTTYAAN